MIKHLTQRHKHFGNNGTRTLNLWIVSPVLYPLRHTCSLLSCYHFRKREEMEKRKKEKADAEKKKAKEESESESEEEEEAPRGDITKMMSSMPAEWSSTEDDLEFAESSAGEEDDAPFEAPVSNTLESVQESSGLDFAASSATDTASETSETPVATSSGLDFAESSAVETGSSGVEFAAFITASAASS